MVRKSGVSAGADGLRAGEEIRPGAQHAAALSPHPSPQTRGPFPGGYRIYGPEAVARLVAHRRAAPGRPAAARHPARARRAHTAGRSARGTDRRAEPAGRATTHPAARGAVAAGTGLEAGRARHAQRLSKESWTQMFQAIGMSDADMRQWHVNFERNMPEAHADFLHSLGLASRGDPAHPRLVCGLMTDPCLTLGGLQIRADHEHRKPGLRSPPARGHPDAARHARLRRRGRQAHARHRPAQAARSRSRS